MFSLADKDGWPEQSAVVFRGNSQLTFNQSMEAFANLLPAVCFKKVGDLSTITFEDPTCFKLLLSKLLGYLVVLGATIYKVPQIVTILRKSSVAGLSLQMYLVECLSFSVTLAYNLRNNNPFSTWGETIFMIVQNVIIVLLIFHYQKKSFGLVSFVAFYSGLNYIFLSEKFVSMDLLKRLTTFMIPVFAYSRIPQILSNYNNKSTGALSLITCLMQFGGNAARVFTTLQEVRDIVILIGFLVPLVLNGILFFQVVYYNYMASPSPVAPEHKHDKKLH